MSSKTRIIVLHMKEVVYTIAFLILAILLGVLIYFMFGPGRSQTTSGKADSLYTPGVYRSSITLNQNTFDVEVTVDQNSIQSVELVNLSESTPEEAASLILPRISLNWMEKHGESLALEPSAGRWRRLRKPSDAIFCAIPHPEANTIPPMSR